MWQIKFSSVQSLIDVQFFVTPWPAAHQDSLSFTISRSLVKLMSIDSVMLSNHLLALQGALKSLLQHHILKASILWCSAFFMVQLWLLHMTTGSITDLTIQAFVGKVMSILSPSICHEVMGPDAMILIFWMSTFKPSFSLYSFTFINRLLSSSLLSAIRVMSSVNLRLLLFLPESWYLLELHPAQHFTWCTLHRN